MGIEYYNINGNYVGYSYDKSQPIFASGDGDSDGTMDGRADILINKKYITYIESNFLDYKDSSIYHKTNNGFIVYSFRDGIYLRYDCKIYSTSERL